MSSAQCYKPCEQTNYDHDKHKVDKCYEKTKDHQVDKCNDKTKDHKVEKCHDKSKDNSISLIVKEITDSAKNYLNKHDGTGGAYNGHTATHKPTNDCSTGIITDNSHSAHRTEKKKTEGHCLPKLYGHGHKDAHAGHIKKKKNKGAKHNNESCSDSSDSDNES